VGFRRVELGENPVLQATVAAETRFEAIDMDDVEPVGS
jgi:hypothetical protein